MTDYIKRTDAVKIAEKYRLANGSVLGWHTRLADCIASEILSLPAADVAPVVRCKDCKYHYDCGVHFCNRIRMDCPDDSDFFCSYGERKDNDEH